MKKLTALVWSTIAAVLVLFLCFHFVNASAAGLKTNLSGLSGGATGSNAQAVGVPALGVARLRLTPADRRRRERWQIERHGFNLGVPNGAYAKAMKQRLRMEAAAIRSGAANITRAALGGGTWNFIGPMPMKGQQANFTGDLFGPAFDAAGRVTAIAVDPAGNIYVGAAAGGVWLSKDGGTTFTWISKDLPTQSIGSIAIDNLATPPIVYVGTGEGNYSDSYYGLGLFSTQDFGKDWTPVDPSRFTANGKYQAFTSLAVPCSGNPFAGTGNAKSGSRGDASISECEPGLFSTGFDCMQGAIYESLGGTDWHRTFGEPNPADPNGGPVRSLVLGVIRNPDFSAQPAMFGSIDFLGLVVTNDNTGLPFSCGIGSLAGWSVLSTVPFGSVGRSSVATGVVTSNPSSNQTVYAMIGDSKGERYDGFISSGSGGSSWTEMTVPCAATSDKGATWQTDTATCVGPGVKVIDGPLNPAPAGDSSSQSDYDQALQVWPADATAQTVYFGGIGIYRTTDGGKDWDFLGKNGGTHSDQHAIAFDPTDPTRMYVGNDGGAYRFNTSTNSWTSLNDTINSGQVYVVGPHPTDNNKVLAGFQDNGVQLYTGALGWGFSFTSDGGFNAFDHSDPTVAYMTIFSPLFSVGACPTKLALPQIFSSNNGGQAGTWLFQPAIQQTMANNCDSAGFTPPFAVDPVVPHRLVIGGHMVYVSTNANAGPNAMGNGTAAFALMSPQDVTGCSPGCAITDLEFAPGDHTVLYTLSSQAVNSDGTTTFPFKIFVTNHADLNAGVVFSDITGGLPFSTSITQATTIAVSPFDPKTAYLGLSGYNANTNVVTPPPTGAGFGHIWKTTDMGKDFVEADAGLPDIPVLRLIVDKNDPTGKTVIAGTDVGIFRSTDGAGSWSDFNLSAIPTTPVFDLEQNDNGVLFAGTHGSGVWELIESTATATPTATFTFTPTPTFTFTPTPTFTFTPTPTFTSTPTPTPTPESPTPTITPTPTLAEVRVTPPSLSYTTQFIGTASAAQLVTINNAQLATITLSSLISGPAAADFVVTATTCGATLRGKQKCTISIAFKPRAAGTRSATLTVTDSPDTLSPHIVTLSGTGQFPVGVAPSSLSFGKENVGKESAAKSVSITNNQGVSISLSSSISGADAADFVKTAATTCGTSLGAKAGCAISVAFKPGAAGARSATLNITDSPDVDGPHAVSLSGSGVATPTPTPTATATPVPGTPVIGAVPKVILVGGSFTITGTGFTAGSVVNFFVATSTGPVNAGPFTPTSRTLPTQLTVKVPATTPLGAGFVEVQVVNTDTGFKSSNLAPALLQGAAAAGIPSLTSIDGVGLAATSSDPSFAVNNVDTVVVQGSVVKLGGNGFDTVNGVAVDLYCACPGGKVGPFFLKPGMPGLTSTLLSLTIPSSGLEAPATGPGAFVISNAGATHSYAAKSNAVSVPIGQQISVTSVSQSGTTITVNGTGFSTRTVINFFNTQSTGVVNLGGFAPGGAPNIPLTFVNSDRFEFTQPAAAVAGASYVQALNPPFVPFTSSGNDPGGSFMLK
jgi:hypothetical protein